jgi:serine/threonine protein kinase
MQNFEFSERGAAFYVAQVVLMLEYMHERQVAYRDVKPENLMLANDGYLRLVDFGLSKFLAPGERTFTFCGTPLYLAPEIWGHGGHDKAVDWWALGCLAYELASNGTLPFHGETQGDIRKKILNEPVSFDGAAKRFSPELRALVEGLLQKNQHKRLGVLRDGAGGVKTSAWFRDLDWIALARMEYPPPFTPDAAGGSKEALRITPRDQELVPPPSRECPMYGDMFPDF